jgi:hypothetical protein
LLRREGSDYSEKKEEYQQSRPLTVYHFRGHDSLSLAVFNGIVLWGTTDQTGTGYRVPLAFESDIRLEPAGPQNGLYKWNRFCHDLIFSDLQKKRD